MELHGSCTKGPRAHLEIVELDLALDVVLLAVHALVEHEEHRRRDVARVDVPARARLDRASVRVYRDLLAALDLVDAQPAQTQTQANGRRGVRREA